MSDIFICGIGAVSPAGWGIKPLREALGRGEAIATRELSQPGNQPLRVRQVPPATPRPAFLAHARLRRTSPIAHYSVSAALEALGGDAPQVTSGSLRLGIVYCALTGCVNYSRRFYDEVLKNPSTASPLVFPETVYNSPASHLAALLNTTAINYTLVGDPGTFLQGLVLAADWLTEGRVNACLVIGAEEMDWLTASAMHLFEPRTVFSEGAGTIYLRSVQAENAIAQLKAVTSAFPFSNGRSRAEAVKRARTELRGSETRALLCDGLQNFPLREASGSAIWPVLTEIHGQNARATKSGPALSSEFQCPNFSSGNSRADAAEKSAWSDWSGARLSVKTVLGDALMASSAWQCVAAVDALAQNAYDTANVSIAGTNQQAIAAQFARCGPAS